MKPSESHFKISCNLFSNIRLPATIIHRGSSLGVRSAAFINRGLGLSVNWGFGFRVYLGFRVSGRGGLGFFILLGPFGTLHHEAKHD